MNAIAPGFIKTRMLDGVPDKAMASVLDIDPARASGRPHGDRRRSSLSRPPRRPASSRVTCSTSTAAWRCDADARIPPVGTMEVAVTLVLRNGVDQQMAWLAEQQRSWQRMLSFPRAVELARETQVGVDAARRGVRRGHAQASSLPEGDAGDAMPNRCCSAMPSSTGTTSSILQPDKSVVQRYLDRGFDVYMIDWGVPSDADHGLTLKDYVCEITREGRRRSSFVSTTARISTFWDIAWGGRCRRCSPSFYPERVKSLTLMAAPIDFGGRESLAQSLDRSESTSTSTLSSIAYGNCPASFLQSCFLLDEAGAEPHRKTRRILRAAR